MKTGNKGNSMTPYLTPAGAWALSLGTSIGWGSLVITSTTYLSKAGPFGSLWGMVFGTVIMLIISRSYHYMMNIFPEAGGAYSYSKEVFGFDHGFVTAWFLALTYFAVLWANTTSLPLFARYFIGDMFRFGYLYTCFGYEVYLGEVLLSVLVLFLTAWLVMRHKNIVRVLLIGMAVCFLFGIVVCFAAAMLRLDCPLEPAFIPDEKILIQVVRIAAISPWAFIGFENISHSAEEFTFPLRKTFRILVAAVISSAMLYIFLTFLSASCYPPEYGSWLEYIRDIGNLNGIKGLPTFYAAQHYLGNFGIWMLILSLMALILSSLIGNILALSRLLYSVAQDNIIPEKFAELNEKGIPGNAVVLTACISALIPLAGRTAIGWIVDVTTIGATLVYGFVSACSLKMGRERDDRVEIFTGGLGLVIMIVIGCHLLLPNILTGGTMEPQTYILFTVWAVLGFVFFHYILKRDNERRFGYSIIVWIVLLSLILFSSMTWMGQANVSSAEKVLSEIQEHYDLWEIEESGQNYIDAEFEDLHRSNTRSVVSVFGMFGISLLVLVNNFSIMQKRARENEIELGNIRDIANRDPLTGVKSKHAYFEQEHRVNEALAENPALEFGIVVCDVNGLKAVNDLQGHKAGDEYICEASRMVCEIFQHSPVFRIGGDEFAVLLMGRDYEIRDELLNELNRRAEANIGTGKATLSAGMAEYRSGTDRKFHSVFERADEQMYQRKKQMKSMGVSGR